MLSTRIPRARVNPNQLELFRQEEREQTYNFLLHQIESFYATKRISLSVYRSTIARLQDSFKAKQSLECNKCYKD